MTIDEALRLLKLETRPGTPGFHALLRAAWRTAATSLHPDKHPEATPEFTERFQEAQTAYKLLQEADRHPESESDDDDGLDDILSVLQLALSEIKSLRQQQRLLELVILGHTADIKTLRRKIEQLKAAASESEQAHAQLQAQLRVRTRPTPALPPQPRPGIWDPPARDDLDVLAETIKRRK